MQTCPGFLKKSLLEYPGNLLEICSVKSVDTLNYDLQIYRVRIINVPQQKQQFPRTRLILCYGLLYGHSQRLSELLLSIL